jgi:hypothetical protein
LQSGDYCVPTIYHDWAVGIAAQALAAGTLKPLTPLDLLARGTRFRTGAGPAGGLS